MNLGEVASALSDLDEWARGVLFPLAVLFIGWCAVGSLRCLRNILGEFRQTRLEVRHMRTELAQMRSALIRAGIMPGEFDHPDG